MDRGRKKPWQHIAGGLLIRFHLIPKSSKDCVEAVEATTGGPAFKARVRAAPEDGKANRALAALVAEWLAVPKSSVSLRAGAKSRVKTLIIAGDGGALAKLVQSKARPATSHGAQQAR
jgi:uncharacterized protein YggU (UPF0235/DUF167 family)